MFEPYLEKIVETTKKFIGYWGEKDGNAYNRLLDQYEPGMTSEMIDGLFEQLTETIVPLVKKINAQNKQPDTSFLFKKFPKEQQIAFNHYLLEKRLFQSDTIYNPNKIKGGILCYTQHIGRKHSKK